MLVDIHQHLLYGVDDGSKTLGDAQAMLRRACEQGVTHLVLTPHATPGEEKFPAEECSYQFQELQVWCDQEELPILLYSGAEILYTDATVRALTDMTVPTLAGTRHVLVEFLPTVTWEELQGAARRLGSVGYSPVFAHVERYRCLRSLDRLAELHDDYQVITQVNANTFLRKKGFLENRWLRMAMEEELIDVAASDAHGMSFRPCQLGECYREIKKTYGTDMARRLCVEYPGYIIGLT